MAPRDVVHVHREGQGRLQDPERLLLPRVAGDAVLKVKRTERGSNICRGRLPLEGKDIHATLPPQFPLPSSPLVPTPPPAHFALSRGATCGLGPLIPGLARAPAPATCPYALARRPARLRRAHPSEGNNRRPTMPKASPPVGSPFRTVRAGEPVVWCPVARQPDRINEGIS